MSTYGVMQSRIADELIRSDLASQIRSAIQSAIKHYERELFWFNEARAFTDTADEQEYYALPSDFVEMITMVVNVHERVYPLNPRNWEYLEDINWGGTTFQGYPEDFAIFANQFRLYPIPNGVYRLTISYTRTLPVLSAESDTNEWMTEGEELIRARAKWILYVHTIMDPMNAQMMKAVEGEALNSLRKRTTKQVSVGKLRPTHF